MLFASDVMVQYFPHFFIAVWLWKQTISLPTSEVSNGLVIREYCCVWNKFLSLIYCYCLSSSIMHTVMCSMSTISYLLQIHGIFYPFRLNCELLKAECLKEGPIRSMPPPPQLGISFWLSSDAVITSELHSLKSVLADSMVFSVCLWNTVTEETSETILTDLFACSVSMKSFF